MYEPFFMSGYSKRRSFKTSLINIGANQCYLIQKPSIIISGWLIQVDRSKQYSGHLQCKFAKIFKSKHVLFSLRKLQAVASKQEVPTLLCGVFLNKQHPQKEIKFNSSGLLYKTIPCNHGFCSHCPIRDSHPPLFCCRRQKLIHAKMCQNKSQ